MGGNRIAKRHNFYNAIRKLLKEHYERIVELLCKQLQVILSYTENSSDHILNILEIGPGENSIVLEAIERLTLNYNNNKTLNLHLCFVDIDFLPQIRGTQLILINNSRVKNKHSDNKYEGRTNYNNINISYVYHHCDYFKWDAKRLGFHLTVFHNVLHELILQSNQPKEIVVPNLFRKISDGLIPEGLLFLGDPYYPSYLDYIEVKNILQAQQTITDHADPPCVFIPPERLLELIYKSSKYEIVLDEQRAYLISNDDLSIMRKLYVICLKKLTSDVNESNGVNE